MNTELETDKRAELRQRKLAVLKGVTHIDGPTYHLSTTSIPQQVIDAVLATTGLDSEPISGYRIFKDQILRVKRLSIAAYARFEFYIPTAPPPFRNSS